MNELLSSISKAEARTIMFLAFLIAITVSLLLNKLSEASYVSLLVSDLLFWLAGWKKHE